MLAEPSIEGWLDVGDRQQIWWGRYGTPTGTPAVVLQGGPGSGCPDQWAWFDLNRADVVLVDQRRVRPQPPARLRTGHGPVGQHHRAPGHRPAAAAHLADERSAGRSGHEAEPAG